MIFIKSPGHYIQKPGIIEELAAYVKDEGEKPYIICTSSNWRRCGDAVERGLGDMEHSLCTLDGDADLTAMKKAAEEIKTEGCDCVIGLGGGRLLDAAKAAAHFAELPAIIIPTVASTDAPCSGVAVIHNSDGGIDELLVRHNPAAVLVDTKLLINAPVRMFTAGMGDALATYFEAAACFRSKAAAISTGTSSEAALALSRQCLEILYESGAKALADAKAKRLTPDFERVIYANTYLSGTGFENGGLAAAHAINNGMAAQRECAHLNHGELVAFGTLCQLSLEGADSGAWSGVLGFMADVGLPATFEALGIAPEERLLNAIADGACAGPIIHNVGRYIEPCGVVAAMKEADERAREYLRGAKHGN